MAIKQPWIFLLGVFLLIALAGNLFAQEKSERRRPGWQGPKIGAVVEDFELPLLDGGTFKLSDQRGRILVIEMGACT